MKQLARISALALVAAGLVFGGLNPAAAASRFWNSLKITAASSSGACTLTVSPAIVGSGLVTGDTVSTNLSSNGVTGCNGPATITVNSSTSITLNSTTASGTMTGTPCAYGGHWTSTNTANWATSSTATCGSGGATVPGSGDTPTFDANSGGDGATVGSNLIIVDAGLNGNSYQGITAGQLNGTLDFSAISGGSLTATNTGFFWSGTGVRKYVLPAGGITWNANCNNCSNFTVATTTGLDASTDFSAQTVNVNANTSNTSGQAVTMGGKTLGTLNITLTGRTGGASLTLGSANDTFTNFNFVGSGTISLNLPASSTITATNGITWSGSSSAVMYLNGLNTTINVLAGTSWSWTVLHDIVLKNSGTLCTTCTATNSIDLLGNSGVTITAPSGGGGGGGGGGHVVGG